MDRKILYMTKTGHSRKIAHAIADTLELEALDAKTNPDLSNTDLLIVVGGIYAGRSNPELIEFMKRIDSTLVKHAVLITSCASKKFFQKEVRAVLFENGIEVFPKEFVCRGNFLFVGLGHPNKQDFADAIDFTKQAIDHYQS